MYFPEHPIERVGVTDCEPCASNPCQNGGQCLDTVESPGFGCQCRLGYSGRTCEVYGNGCYPEACANGRCVNLDDGGYKCICAVGYTGERCDEGELAFLFVHVKKWFVQFLKLLE